MRDHTQLFGWSGAEPTSKAVRGKVARLPTHTIILLVLVISLILRNAKPPPLRKVCTHAGTLAHSSNSIVIEYCECVCVCAVRRRYRWVFWPEAQASILRFGRFASMMLLLLENQFPHSCSSHAHYLRKDDGFVCWHTNLSSNWIEYNNPSIVVLVVHAPI